MAFLGGEMVSITFRLVVIKVSRGLFTACAMTVNSFGGGLRSYNSKVKIVFVTKE